MISTNENAGGRATEPRSGTTLTDIEQLTQVFANLLDNAIKYREPRRPLSVKISGTQVDGEV